MLSNNNNSSAKSQLSSSGANNNNNTNGDLNLRYQVVFVDPLDYDAPYWWPALIVPEDEIQMFKKQVGNFKGPKKSELVVCYFENCSFSITTKNDILPFSTSSRIYQSYIRGTNKELFLKDKNVQLAVKYLETGKLPSCFTWAKKNTSNNIVSKKTIRPNDNPTTPEQKHNKKQVLLTSDQTIVKNNKKLKTNGNKPKKEQHKTITESDEKCYCCREIVKKETCKSICIECCDKYSIVENTENLTESNSTTEDNNNDDGLSSPNSNANKEEENENIIVDTDIDSITKKEIFQKKDETQELFL